jgi:hypothetical protein
MLKPCHSGFQVDVVPLAEEIDAVIIIVGTYYALDKVNVSATFF